MKRTTANLASATATVAPSFYLLLQLRVYKPRDHTSGHYLIVMERAVVGDDLAGEEGQTDDNEKERVQGRAGYEQA